MQNKHFNPPTEITHDLEAGGALKKILVLEDEGEFTELMSVMLQSKGFYVVSVRNGVEGLRHVMKEDFDVLVCDMMMPSLPGDMFYLAVQRVKPHLCKRFIFMTGHKGEKRIDEFIRRVRGLMLWKPFESHQLLEMINLVLRKS